MLDKASCQKLIDRLSDKTLSFGVTVTCNAKTEAIYAGNFGKKELVFYKGSLHQRGRKPRINEVLGHPVLKCHVEQKLLEIGYMDNPKWDDGDRRYFESLWIECGFKRSMQEIMECGFEEWLANTPGKEKKMHNTTRLKDPSARALFTFLDKILPKS